MFTYWKEKHVKKIADKKIVWEKEWQKSWAIVYLNYLFMNIFRNPSLSDITDDERALLNEKIPDSFEPFLYGWGLSWMKHGGREYTREDRMQLVVKTIKEVRYSTNPADTILSYKE